MLFFKIPDEKRKKRFFRDLCVFSLLFFGGYGILKLQKKIVFGN